MMLNENADTEKGGRRVLTSVILFVTVVKINKLRCD